MSQSDYTFDRNELNESILSTSNSFRVELSIDLFKFEISSVSNFSRVELSTDLLIFDARMTNFVKLSAEFFLIFSTTFNFSIVESRFNDSKSRTNTVERRNESKFNDNDVEHDSNQEFVHSENFEIDIHSIFAHMRHHSAIVKQKQIKKFNKNNKTHEFKMRNILKIIIFDRFRVVKENRLVFLEQITRIIKITRQHTIQTKFDVLNRQSLIKEFDVLISKLNTIMKNDFFDKSKTIIMKQLTKYQFKSKQKQISCNCKSFSCFFRCICQKHDKRCFIYCYDVDQKCDNVVEKFEFQQYALMN